MGVFGWTMLADSRTVVGTLASWNIDANDGDLCMKLIPRSEDQHLLTNPLGNVTNTNGQIECEVRPHPGTFDSTSGARFLDPVVGRPDVQVTVTGVWVSDNGHNYTGGTTSVADNQNWVMRGLLDIISGGANELVRLIPVPDPNHGKTELHPGTAILIEYPTEDLDPTHSSRQVDFLVLSDDPSTWLPYRPSAPPHSGENVTASFTALFPLGRSGYKTINRHRYDTPFLDADAQSLSMDVTTESVTVAIDTGAQGHYYLSLKLFTDQARPGQRNFLQGTWGGLGNYELLVPQGQRLVHYARLNDPGADQFRWIYIRELSFAGVPLGGQRYQLGATPVSVSLLQSTFSGDGIHGNLDAVVRVTPDGVDEDGDTLDFIALDTATNSWSAPRPILVNDQPITGVTGDPIMIQGTWGGLGNYELLVPQGQRLVHYARLNDPGADQFRWIYIRELSFAGVPLGGQRYQLGATPVSVSLLQSTFSGDGIHGNLDAVVRVTPDGVDEDGDTLDFIALDTATNSWSAPRPILVNDQPITGVTGDPIMIQGTWGGLGNYELLVPQGQRLVHYARLNDPGADQFRWIYIRELSFAGVPLGGQRYQLGATPVSVSLLQSTFSGDGIHGNLDAVVRVTPEGVDEDGDTLDFIALDTATNSWSAPRPILVNDQPITGVTGG